MVFKTFIFQFLVTLHVTTREKCPSKMHAIVTCMVDIIICSVLIGGKKKKICSGLVWLNFKIIFLAF